MRDVVVDAAGAAAYVTGVVAVMQHDRFRRQHLLAEACRHLAQTFRGMPRALGLDQRIVEAAPAAYCRDRPTLTPPTELTALEEEATALTDPDGIPRPPLRYGHAVRAGLWLQGEPPAARV